MRTLIGRFAWAALAVSLLVGLVATTAQADQNAAYKKYRGQLVVSDTAIPENLDAAALKKLAKTVLDGGGPWSFHFVAFMKVKPTVSPIWLAFYDVTAKRTFVTAKEIGISPGSNILVSQIEVSAEDGLEKGHTYEVLLSSQSGKKETVYAKTKLTLK